ncbi:nucleotidyl transferase AbiEii/AbiGii toxin family protein [Phytoactinopolyspora limicola]|uniref:nucleotidyl transferase AbiEii/AbiGii toxin family protein n=1 Tax=Phytoactinopolyspora limicola TaxID=2715536 RepID=UPI00140E0C78|nr:nucleotidyl transferase AbiEii/AbiGii toxin family protein [Phytoactinopolyspora limicola]
MDAFHARLVRISLSAVAELGFCLAGGYAIQAHGFLERRSDDVDLFTSAAVIDDRFPAAVRAVVRALESDGLDVEVSREGPTFARLTAADPATGVNSRVELAVDWRAYPPAQLEIGSVLHQDDAVANKFCALFGRGEVRDYIDVDSIVRSGRYSSAELMGLAAQHDPGFDVEMFAEALLAVERFPNSAYAPYGLSTVEADQLVVRTLEFAKQLRADVVD